MHTLMRSGARGICSLGACLLSASCAVDPAGTQQAAAAVAVPTMSDVPWPTAAGAHESGLPGIFPDAGPPTTGGACANADPCACGAPELDSDGDGFLDCADDCPDDAEKRGPAECGCGVPDVDSDGDGVADCNDLCSADPHKVERGECGCGVADADTDGDGGLDCREECPVDPTKTKLGACGCGVPDDDTDGDGTA